MVLESERIIRLDSDFVFRPAAAKVVINMGGVMIDDHNHSAILMGFRGFTKDAGFFQKSAQSGYLFDFEIMGAWTLEEALLGSHHKYKLIIPVRLDLANLRDEVNDCTPT